VVELPVATEVTDLNAKIVLTAVDVVETMALLLREEGKVKALTTCVSWRLVKQNIQRRKDILRVTTNAEDGDRDGIQISL